jgi:hypothetical protein
MLSFILILIIIFIVAGIIGFVVKGLFWLFVIAAILFAITILAGIFGAGRRSGRRRSENKAPEINDPEER